MSPRAAAHNMASATSPLSPRMHHLAVPPQERRRQLHSRQSSATGTAANLRLPSLPRFHPANFASQNSSFQPTPVSGPNSPQPPMSPRTHQQRQYSDAQRQMYLYQREIMQTAARQARGPNAKPSSPRLDPMASPGAVTPLELETAEGYITAGVNRNDAASHVDNLIHKEACRRGDTSPRMTSVGGR